MRDATGFGGAYRKLYLVVHSPDRKLAEHRTSADENVDLVLLSRIAEMAVNLGLLTWLLNKIR